MVLLRLDPSTASVAVKNEGAGHHFQEEFLARSATATKADGEGSQMCNGLSTKQYTQQRGYSIEWHQIPCINESAVHK